MDASGSRSPADEMEALQQDKHAPRPPRGNLTQEQLHDCLWLLGVDMRQARYRAGRTQEQVAEMMGTTKSAVSRLERLGPSVPSLMTLCRYADAIDCSLRVILNPRCPEAGLAAFWGDEGLDSPR